jgi:hypothetical protein
MTEIKNKNKILGSAPTVRMILPICIWIRQEFCGELESEAVLVGAKKRPRTGREYKIRKSGPTTSSQISFNGKFGRAEQ